MIRIAIPSHHKRKKEIKERKKETSMENKGPVYISLEFTPNPNTLKYAVNRELISRGAVNFLEESDAKARSPLAARLFSLGGIGGVMIGKDFVTITKTEEGDWDAVHKQASQAIETHLTAGEAVVTDMGGPEHKSQSENSELVEKIQAILDNEIRPAVAMDGGDITFDRYEAGVVHLHLQGSCAGCPSATMTLKAGIENRLKQEFPEIQEVVSI
jgi:Fe-S cluster biogenesis protein NfuA